MRKLTQTIKKSGIKSTDLAWALRLCRRCNKSGKRVPVILSAGLLISLLSGGQVRAQDVSSAGYGLPAGGFGAGAQVFQFGWENLDSLQYSRTDGNARPVSEYQTELSFKLSPGKFDFSSAGAFGLGGVFANPELAVSSMMSGKYRLQEAIPEIHDGLSYSAGVRIEQEAKDISDTAYVSSSQLGISYGRLGRVWYSGVDVSIGSFSSSSPIADSSEVLSFDLTTGRKMQITGVGQHDPLWLLSLQGNFDLQGSGADIDQRGESSDGSEWYINPSLFWNNPDFTFSAQLQLPVDSDFLRDFEEPDYRLRAIFEKRFR